MDEIHDLAGALEELAKALSASAKRLRKESGRLQQGAELAEVDRALLELHHRIGHMLGEAGPGNAGELPPPEHGNIGFDELTRLLYRTINPPESRRNYTYTPPFSIEKVLRAYLAWIGGPGKGVSIRD